MMSKDFERILRCSRDACKCETFRDAWGCASAVTVSTRGSDAPAQSTASARQVGGAHYLDKTIQPWDTMQAWMTAEAFEGFLVGSAIKYLARHKDKGGKQDLEKAAHYIQKLLEVMP